MPHRIAGQYLYTFLASGGMVISFLASLSESTAAQAAPLFAMGETPEAAISPVMISWLGFLGSAFVVLGKAYVDFRAKKRQADIEDAEAFGPVIVQARKELGDAKAALQTAQTRIADLEATNHSQAAEMKVMQSKIAQLAASQNSVVAAVNKQGKKVKDAVSRVAEIEHVVGSSSNLEIPVAPPTDDPTTLDMPNIG